MILPLKTYLSYDLQKPSLPKVLKLSSKVQAIALFIVVILGTALVFRNQVQSLFVKHIPSKTPKEILDLMQDAKISSGDIIKLIDKEKIDLEKPVSFNPPSDFERKTPNSKLTYLHWAAFFNRWDIIRYLTQKRGISIDIRAEDGSTPLMTAAAYARRERPGTLECLLAHGANVNLQEPIKGNTALMTAIEQRNDESLISTLIDPQYIEPEDAYLQSGRNHIEEANLTIRNKEGKTALDLAKEKNLELVQGWIKEKINPSN